MTYQINRLALALSAAALLTVAGCGGGSGSEKPNTTTMSAKIIDGPIGNALVCLDTNRNGVCDEGEPSGRTDASGSVTLEVPEGDETLYPLVAMVGTDATDADHGPVTTPFTLKAPVGFGQVVSPLTTLVQAHMDATGSTIEEAAQTVQEQLGLETSPMADFTQDASNAGKQAGTVARLVVVTTQNQREATAEAPAGVTAGQIDNAINARLVELLQQLALAILDDPTLSDPNVPIADKQAKIVEAAQQIAASVGLNAENIGSVVAAQEAGAGPEPAGAAGAALRWLTYTDAQHYMFRAFTSTAEQNTPDADGKTHFAEVRKQQNGDADTLLEWGTGANNWPRPQMYWTGSAWSNCPTTSVHEISAPNAAGETDVLYCNAIKTRVKKPSTQDISGRKLIDVVRDIRAYPGADFAHGSYATWGPDPESATVQAALGDQVFPPGSVLSVRTSTDYLSGATFYTKNVASQAKIPPADDPTNPNYDVWPTATLSEFVSWNRGDYDPAVAADGNVHGNNSATLLNRDYVKLNGDAAYKRYMVGFNADAGKARFYECEGDMATRALIPPRNGTLFIDGKSTCKSILETTFTISTQAGRQILRFAAQPTQLAADASAPGDRIFVEDGGINYRGYDARQQTSSQQRLNKPATQALLTALGLTLGD